MDPPKRSVTNDGLGEAAAHTSVSEDGTHLLKLLLIDRNSEIGIGVPVQLIDCRGHT